MVIDHTQRYHTIAFGHETGLATILDLALDAPVLIERNGVRFRIERDSGDRPTRRDSEAFRDALRRTAGTLSGIDGDQLKRDLRRQRGHDGDEE